ncbi:hypothetical protein D3H55_14790 [Bacillus salacetis]|uniref:Two component regulator three Y domain-containing protein n=1 Tax=Bacillus salacetis TaxID=2315464 RepID=A0A3A1QUZ5_9BACI|nr:accessory Sec system protein Asp2 [Bacillus salacetis]RIW31880.1 hypothetical protein D3H55_14790 [Bacillus salacetis]
MFSFNEQEYKSTLPVNYVLEEGESQKDFLVIVFSGFNEKGEKKYNYMKTLRNMDCHKLFILDSYGPRGCYYIGENMSFEVETSVTSLIFYTIRKLGVKPENVICAGSSKGGSAALYFSLKYNLGYSVAGAPQIHIGNYITKASLETADYLLGIDESRGDNLKKLNQLILEQINDVQYTDIFCLTSENDPQYNMHMVPFLERTNEHEWKVETKIDNQIKSHGEIAQAFPDYLVKKLLYIMYKINLEEISIEEIEEHHWRFTLKLTERPPGVKTSIVFKSAANKDVRKHFDKEYELDLNELAKKKPEIYNVYLVLSYEHRELLSYPIKEVLIGKGLVFDGSTVGFENGEINFKVKVSDPSNLEFAFYIKRDNKVIEKLPYGKDNTLTYKVPTKGTYQISYFIKTASGERLAEKSDLITVDNL